MSARKTTTSFGPPKTPPPSSTTLTRWSAATHGAATRPPTSPTWNPFRNAFSRRTLSPDYGPPYIPAGRCNRKRMKSRGTCGCRWSCPPSISLDLKAQWHITGISSAPSSSPRSATLPWGLCWICCVCCRGWRPLPVSSPWTPRKCRCPALSVRNGMKNGGWHVHKKAQGFYSSIPLVDNGPFYRFCRLKCRTRTKNLKTGSQDG